MDTITRQDDEVLADQQRLGRTIRVLRKEKGLSLDELARRVGKSVATVSQIERGGQTITYPVLVRIARALGVTPVGLLWRAQPEPVKVAPDLKRVFEVFDELITKLDARASDASGMSEKW